MTIDGYREKIHKLKSELDKMKELCNNNWSDDKGKQFDECVLEPLIQECNYYLRKLNEI